MPHSVRAWDVTVVCAGTGAAGTSAAVWAVRTHVSGTSPKLAPLRGRGPRSPSPPLPISTSMGSDGQMAFGQ